jgi:outer membrane protein OmpA-like peptidoglycan-associated protein
LVALVSTAVAAPPASADPPRIAPLVDAPFDRPRDSVDATGLTLTVRDLVFPPPRDLVFTVRSLDKSVTHLETGRRTDVSLSNDVLFAFGSSTLSPAAGALLDTVARELTDRAPSTVTVTGYTDSKGTDSVNLPLSRARAAAVLAVLKVRVARPVTFTSNGKGSADPVAPNTVNGKDNPAGRALNRRVTITFTIG